MADAVSVYASIRCPFARRALIALMEKAVVHTVEWIPLSGELQKLQQDPTAVLSRRSGQASQPQIW
jgi:glutathionyl-hydroquinone reductase